MKYGARKYLEYVYGWKPLVSDIYAVMSMLKKKGGDPLLIHGVGRSRVQGSTSAGEFNDVSNKNHTKIQRGEIETRVTSHIWGRIDPNGAGLRSLNQLGLLNPLSLAWELASWSFVIDWFCPIGSVLQALAAPVGLSFVDGSNSLRVSVSHPYTMRLTLWDSYPGGYRTEGPDSSGSVEQEFYQRIPLGGFPLPGTWFNPDPFHGDRGLKALALMITNLRGLRV
jgi:hypothetical protein